MKDNRITWFSGIGWFCLLGDGASGLLLVLAPLAALRNMGVETLPLEPVFIRYIGIFVMSAGLFYLVPRRFPDPGQRLTAWKTVFICMTGLRLLVALFVGTCWAVGRLESGWLSVSAYDLTLAIIQIAVLQRAGP